MSTRMMMSDIVFDFSGKKVLVVGGSYGIGLEIVKQFQSSGAEVFYISRTKSIETDAIHYECDISKPKDIISTFEKIESVDFLINVAAINFCKKICEIPVEEWNDVINTNITSFFLTCKLVKEKMSQGGKIVNYSSIAGRNKSTVSGVHYTASKAAIIGLTRQLSSEYGPLRINVNCVCPSQTMTPMLEKSIEPEALMLLKDNIPVKRIANCKDQAMVSLFLCSTAASYINGAIIDVNGGQL